MRWMVRLNFSLDWAASRVKSPARRTTGSCGTSYSVGLLRGVWNPEIAKRDSLSSSGIWGGGEGGFGGGDEDGVRNGDDSACVNEAAIM